MSKVETYPTINIKFTNKVKKHRQTDHWYWLATLHFRGPDDVFELRSELFLSKQAATEDMLNKTDKTFKFLTTEARK